MRKLLLDERNKLEKTIEPLVSGREVVALCAYGSQVAGYAREESDYDTILVLRGFPQRVRYYYLKGEVDCSTLVVDYRSFERDCQKSSLGEFVAGRLLNPFEALIGEDYLQENEVVYKKRVILEGLIEAYAQYLEFATEIQFGLPYFLFEKLRKRAAIYPPVVYSYAETYGEKLFESNLAVSISGFEKAASLLESEGLVRYYPRDNVLGIPPSRFKSGIAARLEAAASYTTKSLKQYAVHGYAGRVGPNVVGKEVLSKISRSRQKTKLPECIRNSKIHWSIPVGKLYMDSKNWIKDLLEQLGMDPETTVVSEKQLGEIYSSASFFTFDDRKQKISVAAKRYRDARGMKWSILNLWSLKNANFTANPMERLYREYSSIRELKRFGIRTPDILALFLSHRMLVTRFILGKDLSKIQSEYLEGTGDDLEPFRMFGSALATLHNNGYCMGDSKPSNAILSSNGELYLTDLEQAHRNGNSVWDIAEFIYYSIRFTLKEERARRLVNAFCDGYLKKSGNPRIVERVGNLRYRAPFQAFIAPNLLTAVVKDLKIQPRK